ncbi:prepilin peptidase [Patescibacteria group bacterium]|nr:prepilin peptidase [Patescibacteria group bacterium]
MELFFYFFIFLFGLIVGSFLNVVIFRLESGEQVVRGRSHCRHCRHILEWYDLIPVLSFLALGGKCRYCGKALSVQYPLVELATGMLFVAIFNFQFNETTLYFPPSTFHPLLSTLYFLFIASSLIVIFVYDLKHYIIPDKIIYSAIIVSVFYLILGRIWEAGLPGSGFGSPASGVLGFENLIILFNPFIAAIAAGGFFFAIVILTKGAGMGGGDVKLAFLMGLALGWPKILAALFLAFTIGAICGIILIFFKKKNFKSEIPFGPFLVLGTFIALFWGEEIVRWYTGYLF